MTYTDNQAEIVLQGYEIDLSNAPTDAQLKVLNFCITNLSDHDLKRCGLKKSTVLTKANVRQILTEAVPKSKDASKKFLRWCRTNNARRPDVLDPFDLSDRDGFGGPDECDTWGTFDPFEP